MKSRDPVTGQIIWQGCAATRREVEKAVARAGRSFVAWSALTPAARAACVRRFGRIVTQRKEAAALLISQEAGKPLWESRSEVQSVIGKIDLSLRAQAERRASSVKALPQGRSVTRYKPHGVVTVLGPFNFPAHLAHGQIIPALLAGNTVLFKPSEKTPGVGAFFAKGWAHAGLPPGVFQLLQGGASLGRTLAHHPGIDALLFTGSEAVGLALHHEFAGRPDKMLVLEMGGNNPLVVWRPADIHQAAIIVIQSAFITAGQRCTCARRLILPMGTEGDRLLSYLAGLMGKLRVGHFSSEPEPFMGPVISPLAAENVLTFWRGLVRRGGKVITPLRSLKPGTGLLSPGVIDVTRAKSRIDGECFGPLLQVVRVKSFDGAIAEANATRFGLAAGIVTRERGLYRKFLGRVRAGVVNWNQPLTGASGEAPFGGVGMSGNHRPAGYFAADFSSYPVASLEAEVPALSIPTGMDP